MWRDEQAAALAREIESVVLELNEASDLPELVRKTLNHEGRGLSAGGSSLWPLLPMLVCESVCGIYEKALPVAAARQFFVAAADVFDDIEDDDSSNSLPAMCGPAIATNVATTLLILAEKAMARLAARGVPDDLVVRTISIVNSCYITACGGQHLDLSLGQGGAVSEDACTRVMEMKSASQLECACRVGALLGGANAELAGAFTQFGHDLGMASQIANDIEGVTLGADIVNPKMTLPIVYALNHGGEDTREHLLAMFSNCGAAAETGRVRDVIFSSGAIHFCAVKIEFYRQSAGEALSDAERAGANVERLKLMLL